ncbi:hypothetical protein HanRHA438_Chr08g0354181 [Helianthus annuus]|nr:hypothetical protein HanIR_Chr08g0369951 [Helianthus annuus]KAJ0898200.1 hypothetical protein HanRHA438_Chr08g0354181 [Helianthus annuus]
MSRSCKRDDFIFSVHVSRSFPSGASLAICPRIQELADSMEVKMVSIRVNPSSFLAFTCITTSTFIASSANFLTTSRSDAFFWLHKKWICLSEKSMIVSGNS